MTKITVVGATGLIGSKVVELLAEQGQDVVAASRTSGVNVLTGAGVDEAMTGADVV
ncbi:MAG: NAD-dependent epimerase/dehydratase family protein, partial [Actinomycetota bacterium]|nr:NAD-dependent epimerase/dehydratase family protein [Actinomycetota bacterium]